MDRIWEFKTAKLTVFCEWEPEQDEDLSWADEETLENLAQGIYVNVTWHVGVKVNGELYADEYLGNSVYENLGSFRTEHLGISPLTRERLDTAICGGYFIDMVRQCLKDTRKKLQREEEYSDRELRKAALNHRGEP